MKKIATFVLLSINLPILPAAIPPHIKRFTLSRRITQRKIKAADTIIAIVSALKKQATDDLVGIINVFLKDKFDPVFGRKEFGGMGFIDVFNVGKSYSSDVDIIVREIQGLSSTDQTTIFKSIKPEFERRSDALDAIEYAFALQVLENMIEYT